MYFLLILFFASLFGIIFMIGKKLLMLKNGVIFSQEEIVILKTPDLEEWKHAAVKTVKKHGYSVLVATIRLYFRSLNFIKNKHQEVKIKIKNVRGKRTSDENMEKREASGFLKMISEYKQKVRKIKQKVKEEENL